MNLHVAAGQGVAGSLHIASVNCLVACAAAWLWALGCSCRGCKVSQAASALAAGTAETGSAWVAVGLAIVGSSVQVMTCCRTAAVGSRDRVHRSVAQSLGSCSAYLGHFALTVRKCDAHALACLALTVQMAFDLAASASEVSFCSMSCDLDPSCHLPDCHRHPCCRSSDH